VDYQEVLGRLAPCGLDCSRCADYEGGEIKELTAKLLGCLGNYGRLARLKAGLNARFGGYSQFEELLAHFSQASCGGCRAENNRCPFNCKIATCPKEKGIDFCCQCPEYPCDEGGTQAVAPFPERWQTSTRPANWKRMNDRMKETGVVEFYLEQTKLPRY